MVGRKEEGEAGDNVAVEEADPNIIQSVGELQILASCKRNLPSHVLPLSTV